jgi:hypothetical protein
MYIYDITSLNFSGNENFWGKSCRESQNTRFTFGKVFPKIVSFVGLGFIAELFLFLKCYILRFHHLRLRNLQNIRFWHRIYRYAFIRHYHANSKWVHGLWIENIPSITYKKLFNILVSRSAPYAEEITGDHQCQLRRNQPTTDHVFCIRQILLASEEGISSLELCSRTFALYETDWMSWINLKYKIAQQKYYKQLLYSRDALFECKSDTPHFSCQLLGTDHLLC